MDYNGVIQRSVVLLIISLTLGLAIPTDGNLIEIGKAHLNSRSLNVSRGDIVRVVAPARKSSDTTLPLIVNYIESLGLVANISENIYSNEDPFYSNTDEFRANDLISALTDDNVKIIWCVRGGTGSIRSVPYLEDKLPATLKHKIFIGYSDITVLHLYLQYKYGWQTIQGPMVDAIASGTYLPTSESVVAIESLIFDRQDKICIPATKLNDHVNVTIIESRVIGGNAALVEASIGTVWEVRTKGRVFFLEDVGEAAYSIERSLDHMKQARIFDGVDAVIFSDFTQADNDDLMNTVFDRFANSVSFPVFRVTGMGHGPINYPLPFLTHTEIVRNVDGVTYEFCVDNIQETAVESIGNNNTCNNSVNNVHSTSKLVALVVAVITFYLSLC